MAIHHMQKRQAEKSGFLLEEKDDLIRAFWPEYAVEIYAPTGAEAVRHMLSVKAVCAGGEYRMEQAGEPTLVNTIRVQDGAILAGSPMTPAEAYDHIGGKKAEWEPTNGAPEPDAPKQHEVTAEKPLAALIPRDDKGVPLDGGQAHEEGFTAADCPYNSEDEEQYEDFERWNEEFDTHADEAEEEKGGSVVKEEYRARYAEMGHPTHCGDDMATILNNLCQTTKNGTDLDRFETICNANGVSLAKYNRTTNGWQGRLRMTGRNMLAKKIYEAGGVMKTPVDGAEPEYQMSQEWMSTRKFTKG